MTVSELFEYVDEILENPYSDEVKLIWLNQVEAEIQVDVLLMAVDGITQYDETTYGAELIAPAPFDQLYPEYLFWRICLAQQEFELADGYAATYNRAYNEYVRFVCETINPGCGMAETMRYYLTAYQIAVKHGYTGTEEEWVLSLKGSKGEPGAGLSVIGQVKTEMELPVSGIGVGSGYLVGSDADALLYIWNGEEWFFKKSLRGAEGYTPKRGVDYWTPEEQQTVANATGNANAAAGEARAAADASNAAANAATTAASNAKTAANQANTATENTNQAAQSANTAAGEAHAAANAGNTAANAANTAALNAEKAANQANAAAENANKAAETAGTAAGAANAAAQSASNAETELRNAAAAGAFDGDTGPAGVVYGPDEPTDPSHPVWIDTSGDDENPYLMADQGVENAGKILGIGDDGKVIPVDAPEGGNDTPGADGGYYTPAVEQVDSTTMRVSFAASKEDMPAVEAQDIVLPAGPAGNDATVTIENIKKALGYTPADAEEVSQLSAEIGDVRDGHVSIPDYWEDAVAEAETRINEFQNKGGVDAFTFGFITDTHFDSDVDDSGNYAKLMERVTKNCNIPMVLHGGDFVAGHSIIPKSGLISQIEYHDFIFRNIEGKTLTALGNHDTIFGVDANYDSCLTDGETYNYIFRKNQEKSGVVYGEPGTYFYKDIPSQKTRYIVLNCYDYETRMDENQKILAWTKMSNGKIGSSQLKWLYDTALKVPDGYSIIICSHNPPLLASEYPTGWREHCGPLDDAEIVRGVLDAYINKTTYTYSGFVRYGYGKDAYDINIDFANYPGKIVCWVAGHTHVDGLFDLNGLHVVCTANCSSHIQLIDAPTKRPGTDTEYIMDFVCVNKRTKTCNIVRLGAELEGNATCTVTTYTNFADPTSSEWITGKRINSAGEIVDSTTHSVTNFIPAKNKDVIHFSGFQYTANTTLVEYYDIYKKRISYTILAPECVSNYDPNVLVLDTSTVFGEGVESVHYVRISGKLSGAAENAIVTVNEDIKPSEVPGRGFNY